jgi:hypothetical protein
VKILDTPANIDTLINAVECGVAHSPLETILDAKISHLSSTTNRLLQHIDAPNPLNFQRPVITSAIQPGHDIARKRKRETLENSRSVQLLQRVKHAFLIFWSSLKNSIPV